MSTSSVKPIPTLKGIFNAPKMNSRRDFLRENKLSLRELQRVTTKKTTTLQQDQQQKQQRHEQQHQQQQQFYTNRRRSASQQRLPPNALGGHHPPIAAAVQRQNTQQAQQQERHARSISQQRENIRQKQNPSSRCPSCSGTGSVVGGAGGRGGYSVNDLATLSCSIGAPGSVASKAESRDKEIQTEDIHDEEFLYDALKKCASNESHYKANANDTHKHSHSDPNVPLSHRSGAKPYDNEYDQQSYYHGNEEEEQLHENGIQQQQYYKNEENLQNHMPLPSARSHGSGLSVHNGNHAAAATMDDIRSNFDNVTLHSGQCGGDDAHEAPLSGRSRQTQYSTQSRELAKKQSTGSLHKLGSRDDVRLPRYLEREKREKEETRMREMDRDPNCPIGHYVLSEDERVKKLTASEKKFKALINELNHMPMTTETLRIRIRKNEIEKELTILEADIRIFSKPKVYIRQNN